MAVTIKQTEAIPASYPGDGDPAIWQRLESYIAHRFTSRAVVWIVEGCGEWTAAGGPAPNTDWRPQDMSPDLQRAMTSETLAAGREAVCAAFGVLPAILLRGRSGAACEGSPAASSGLDTSTDRHAHCTRGNR
jgi:hypothetical protein